MRRRIWRLALFATLTTAVVGCKPRPVGDETDVRINVDRPALERSTGTGVDVNIGGGKGVDVTVDPERSATDVIINRDRSLDP